MTSTQAPIGSGFGARSTAREVIAGRDLRGAIAIVTGGYSGIGVETTRVLAEAGATVIVPARTPEKARANLAGIPRVELAAVELAEPASIDAFAAQFLASGRPLHLLVNSAGIMAPPLARDARGLESQLATNHVGHFQLAARLWPALVAARGARVIAVSSRGHHFASIDFEDPNFERRAYDKWRAYGQSKTANALFALALDARGEAHGVRAFSVHPGGIATDLLRYMSAEELAAFGLDAAALAAGRYPASFKSVPEGAATQVWAATSPQLAGLGGVYCEDCDVAAILDGKPGERSERGVRPWACDRALADRLWTASEAWAGVAFRP